MSRSGLRAVVEITVDVGQRANAALKSSIDEARIVNGAVSLRKEFSDLGDARAYINSTLRVINAAILTILGNEQ